MGGDFYIVPIALAHEIIYNLIILIRAYSSMAEQGTHNPLAGGSNPSGRTRLRSGETVSHLVHTQEIAGSTPASATR